MLAQNRMLPWFFRGSRPVLLGKIVNEYDQEIPQSQTADNPVAP